MAWLKRRITKRGYRSLRAFCADIHGFPGSPSKNALLQQISRADRLDRRAAVWFESRDEAQRVVAAKLGLDPQDFMRRLTGELDDGDAVEIDLADLAMEHGRPWDVRSDPLFPGVPDEVKRPGSWKRLWWHAPRGAGRSLTGRWLREQFDVLFIRARTWEDAKIELRKGQRCFVELRTPEGAEALFEAEGLEAWQICVAAPFPPPGLEPESRPMLGHQVSTGVPWKLVTSPETWSWFVDFINWAKLLEDPSEPLDTDLTLRIWQHFHLMGMFSTVGDAMALCGLVRVFGESLTSAKNDKICVEWLRRLGERPDLSSSAQGWAKKEAWSALESLLTAEITSTLAAEARTRTEWEGLSNSSVVIELENLGLLSHEGPEQLAPRPSWFWNLARWHVLMDLARGPRLAEAALMRPDDMAERLQAFSMDQLGELMQDVDPSVPASVALCEVLFCAVGRRLYDRHWGFFGQVADGFTSTVERAWMQQGKVAIEIAGRPVPRMGGNPGFITQWTAGALAISHSLHGQAVPWAADPDGALCPWDRAATSALTEVLLSLDHAPTFPAHRLLAHLVQRVPNLPVTRHTSLPLLVDQLARGVPVANEVLEQIRPGSTVAIRITVAHWSMIRPMIGAGHHHHYDREIIGRNAFEAVERLCSATALVLWRLWIERRGKSANDDAVDRYATHAADLQLLLTMLPDSVWNEEESGRFLAAVISRRALFQKLSGVESEQVLPFTLPHAVQQALMETWTDAPIGLHDLDPDLIAARVASVAVSRGLITKIWEQRAEASHKALTLTADSGNTARCMALLETTPDEEREVALRTVAPLQSELVQHSGSRTWAWALVGRRAPGWRTLWTWLA